MTAREVYASIGGDYDEVLSRLCKEDMVKRFAKRFFETGDMEGLQKSVEEGDGNNAFEYAHKLKGNSLNIGFVELAKVSELIVEPLRCREITDPEMIENLLQSVVEEYEKTKALILQIE